MSQYKAIIKADTFNDSKFAVHYTTVDYSIIIAGLHKSTAEDLARMLNSSSAIYVNGIYSNAPMETPAE